jgi:hypothetical protein
MFTIQCFCLGDWLKITKGGPWLFRWNVVCIEKYDGLVSTDIVDLNHFETWIQIHKLPVGYRNEALVRISRKGMQGELLKLKLLIMAWAILFVLE